MKLMIGTKNPDKLKEIKEILAQTNTEFELFSMIDFPDLPDVIEDKDTIEGNAIKKATELVDFTGLPTLSDDTGFFVDALNGEPGVYAARFAGEDCTYRDNRLKVLDLLKNETKRSAWFRTVVAFAEPGKLIGHVKGEVEGVITHTDHGKSGFGYDPIFRLNATGKTFGDAPAEKHGISHRSKALVASLPMLKEYYNI